jgi:hypothetical protein
MMEASMGGPQAEEVRMKKSVFVTAAAAAVSVASIVYAVTMPDPIVIETAWSVNDCYEGWKAITIQGLTSSAQYKLVPVPTAVITDINIEFAGYNEEYE